MALILADRVLETTTTAGSGTITLAGAEPGYQSFSAVGDGNQTYYTIAGDTEWEVGIGTYTASGTTLSRDTVLSSSNSGAKVTFSAGVKKVFVTYPAEKSVNRDVSGNISAASGVITNVASPSAASDAATKLYVDTLAAQGITYHTPVKYEVPNTTGNLTATYNNGTAGVSATLTNAGTLAAFVPDGVTASISDRVLIYNQTNGFENGVYTVTVVGNGSTAWVLTRATDADTYALKSPNSLGGGDAFYVTSGNTGAGETYLCNNSGVITFGSTAISFVQISAAQVYKAGNGISLTNTTISLDTPVAVANGGTGSSATPANGQLLIGNGSNYTLSTLTAGSGVSITNSAGSITLSATGLGGTVTAVTASSPLASSGGTAPNISIANTTGTGSVVLDQGATISSATITAALSASITTITGSSANITTVTGTTAGFSSAAITQLSGTSAGITTVSGTTTTFSSGTITQFGATSATIATVSGTNATYSNGSFTSATVTTVSGTTATYTSATVTNLNVTSVTLSNLSIASANITTLTGTTFGTTATTHLRATSAEITTLTSSSANITTLTGTTFGTTSTTQLRGASGAITNLTGTNLSYGSATVTTGNLTFSGTAQRITGDMTNATIPSRLAFQTNTTNGSTVVTAIPNGTSNIAAFSAESDSAATNSSTLQIVVRPTTGDAAVIAGIRGTGTYLPMTFYTNNSERMRLDTSGNVGIGGTVTQYGKLSISNGESDGNQTVANSGLLFRNTGGWSSAAIWPLGGTGFAGSLLFGTVPSGSPTNTVTERMRITSSGNVGIGTASPTSPVGFIKAVRLTDATSCSYVVDGASATAEFGISSGGGWLATNGAVALRFGTNSTEQMRIDSSGNVGIGTTPLANTKLDVLAGANQRFLVRERSSGAVCLDSVVANNTAYQTMVLNGSTVAIQTSATNRVTVDASGNVIMTANLDVGGQITTRVTSGATPIVNAAGSNSLQVTGNTTNGAWFSFHRYGAYAINMGLDTSNVLSCGGWSDGANYRWQVDASGNFTARGNVTAYSDERVKKNWRPVQENLIEKISAVKSGVYDRTDADLTQVGVSAQSLREVLPEAVFESNDGGLSVAYGNAALVAVIELAKEVIKLKAEIEALKRK